MARQRRGSRGRPRATAASVAGSLAVQLVLILFAFLTVYPFWHVIMYSISDPQRAMEGGLFLWPRGLNLTAYKVLLQGRQVTTAYANSILRTAVGTLVNIVLTASLAYPLSVRRFMGRNFLSMMIFFTMLFSGGMIPSYILVQKLGLYDSRLALILPGAISAYNLFIMKTYFQGLPESLEESALLDGATPGTILVRIILPISAPIIAALTLFYGVDHWNAFFDAILYIQSSSKQVLQVFLRSMIQAAAFDQMAGSGMQAQLDIATLTEESMKMAAITASIVPVLIVYPLLQRYYVKGIMIGAIKG